MEELSLLENDVQKQPSPGIAPSDSWKDSPSIQHLLDTISSIIAKEFIAVAKQNPEVFSEIASGASRPRNDKMEV